MFNPFSVLSSSHPRASDRPTGSRSLSDPVRRSQESPERNSPGKKARTGRSPASEDDGSSEDGDPRPDCAAQVKAQVQTGLQELLPGIIASLKADIIQEVKADFDRALQFVLAGCQEEMAKRVAEVRRTWEEEVQGLKAQLERHATRSAKLTSDVQVVQHKTGVLEVDLDAQDQRARSTHLVIGNLREGEEGDDPRRGVAAILQLSVASIQEARRLGPPRASGERPRNLLVKLTDLASRAAAFRRGAELRRKGIYLDAHITTRQQQERFEKRDRYHELRRQNARPFWWGSTIVYHDGDRLVLSCIVSLRLHQPRCQGYG